MNEILTERQNLFEPNVYVAVCAEVSGDASPEMLICAVNKAYEANEAAMSKIVLKDGLAYYEKLPETKCKTEICNKNWIDILNQNQKDTFVIDKGELIRTFIIPLKDKIQILIMAHHLAGDGKSIIFLLKDIMEALSGADIKYKPMTLITKKQLTEEKLSRAAKFFIKYCDKKWENFSFGWEDYYNMHSKYWNAYSSDIQYRTLTTEETEKITDGAKQIGCSVNSYILTSILQKTKRRCDTGVPVSIREKSNEAMTNLVLAVNIKYKYKQNRTFEENAKIIHQKIADKLKYSKLFVLKFISELPPTLIDAVLLNTYNLYSDTLATKTAKIMGYQGEKKRDCGVSNLTVIDIPSSYGNLKLDSIIFVPPAVSYSNNSIGISTFNGQLTFSIHNIKTN